jgi:hypothetical protein
MDQREAEDKPKRRRWWRRNLLWEKRFEYFGHTGGASNVKAIPERGGKMRVRAKGIG